MVLLHLSREWVGLCLDLSQKRTGGWVWYSCHWLRMRPFVVVQAIQDGRKAWGRNATRQYVKVVLCRQVWGFWALSGAVPNTVTLGVIHLGTGLVSLWLLALNCAFLPLVNSLTEFGAFRVAPDRLGRAQYYATRQSRTVNVRSTWESWFLTVTVHALTRLYVHTSQDVHSLVTAHFHLNDIAMIRPSLNAWLSGARPKYLMAVFYIQVISYLSHTMKRNLT